MHRKIVILLLGGEAPKMGYLCEFYERASPLALICADGGAKVAREAGLKPTLIVGDMDSLSDDERAFFEREGVPIIVHPSKKDETDAILALEHAFRYNPQEIWVFGALGRRLDHTLANLTLLLRGEARGVMVKLIGEDCEVFLVKGEKRISGEAGDTVSLLALFEDASEVTLEGFAYPLKGGKIMRDFPLGISNELTGKEGRILVGKGNLIGIRYFRREA